ncbi:DUF3305 domain-containing protein [Rhodospirillaceae bacterium SYSU D60014]|uniref:DUF3305 domain-containing protein n=1 Tax=Virgifigura deserti TaxID=2268457 RepID=UPI000E6661AD
MAKNESMRVGVVVERRKIDHPWQEYAWRPVAVVPGAPSTDGWRLLHEEGERARYLAGGLSIELFPGETGGYRHNLSQKVPVVFVILRSGDDESGPPFKPFHTTVCPYEAEEYLDGGDDTVEAVPMPEAIAAWVGAYVAAYHRDVPFKKRKRKPHRARGDGSGGLGLEDTEGGSDD